MESLPLFFGMFTAYVIPSAKLNSPSDELSLMLTDLERSPSYQLLVEFPTGPL